MKTKIPILAAVATLAWAALASVHFASIRRLDSELTALRRQVEARSQTRASRVGHQDLASELSAATADGEISLSRRLTELEQEVERLSQAADYLMDRGQLGLATNKLEGLYSRLSDPAASDADRLQALAALRRDRALSDEVVGKAITWLDSASDPRTRREILKQLDGSTNATLKATLLGLVARERDGNIRQEAVEDLRHFVNDPQAENLLWQLLGTDPDEKVRQKAQDALQRGPVSGTRAAALRDRALDAQVPLEERVTAMRALSHGNVDAPEVMASLAELAQNTQDPIERAKLFRAFDGIENPAFKAPLVYGLQDQNPVVRKEAANALSGFTSDPQVQQWLRYVAGNDGDPKVRREAFKALEGIIPRQRR
jgi:HEAT repeat protein